MTAWVLAESTVEETALAWLEGLGYAIQSGPVIAPGELFSECEHCGQVVLEVCLRNTPVHRLRSKEVGLSAALKEVAAQPGAQDAEIFAGGVRG